MLNEVKTTNGGPYPLQLESATGHPFPVAQRIEDMPRLRKLQAGLVLAAAIFLAACGSSQPGKTDVPSAEPSGSAAAASQPVQHYQASIALDGLPQVTTDGRNLMVTVRVTNTGSDIFGSETAPHPVNLGAHSIDGTGKIVNNDVSRGHLPQVAPGATVTATILLATDQLLNKRAEILPVQENVGWFDSWGTKPLIIGPFTACGGTSQGALCDAGRPLATVPAPP